MRKILTILLVILIVSFITGCSSQMNDTIPYWLYEYKETFKESPNKAAKYWFKEAKFGMFVHLNLASLCQNGKADYIRWVNGDAGEELLDFVGYSKEVYTSTPDKNELLYKKYSLTNFNAEDICQLAIEAKMKYITFTTSHLGRCYNFKTAQTDFTSLNAPVGRDLAMELANACKKYGLVLFFYVPPEFARTDSLHLEKNRNVLKELLTQYGDIGGIWFDGIGDFYHHPENYTKLSETFNYIKSIQPHALVSFKEGAICEEDFLSPEHFMLPYEYDFNNEGQQERFNIRLDRWKRQNNERWENCNKHLLREVNTVMQECYNRDRVHVKSGWINDKSARHWSGSEVFNWLTYARYTGSNLLMNIGPQADGSIHPDDAKALKELGSMIEKLGWPQLKNEVEIK